MFLVRTKNFFLLVPHDLVDPDRSRFKQVYQLRTKYHLSHIFFLIIKLECEFFIVPIHFKLNESNLWMNCPFLPAEGKKNYFNYDMLIKHGATWFWDEPYLVNALGLGGPAAPLFLLCGTDVFQRAVTASPMIKCLIPPHKYKQTRERERDK